MNFPLQVELSSLKDTEQLASELSTIFKEGGIVVLNGNLGTGKTTLIKFICGNYGIENVTSPSFSIVNEYENKIKVFHFDFYRLKKVEELYDIGFEEYVNDSTSLIFIEWGNLMPEILPQKYYEIKLSFGEQNNRLVKITKKN